MPFSRYRQLARSPQSYDTGIEITHALRAVPKAAPPQSHHTGIEILRGLYVLLFRKKILQLDHTGIEMKHLYTESEQRQILYRTTLELKFFTDD